jgi:cytochrome c-type biogenesis protein CcmH/NrfF
MMPDQIRRLLRFLLPAVALAVIVAGLWPQPSTPPTPAERVDALASNIRCPFCGGESIADAPSQIARDLEVIIAEQVADGRTDAEIYDYFESRYGESALIDPPLTGWGWVLWAGPLVLLLAGGYAIVRRRRSDTQVTTDAPAELARRKLEDQLGQIELDLADLEVQVADGEIDDATRFDLAAAYEAEAAPLRARLAVLDRPEAAVEESGSPPPAPGTGPDRRRAFIGAAGLLAGIAVVSFALVRMADDGGDAIEVPTPPPVDLSNVTVEELENVVARNPDIIGMRLALAQLYMQRGDVQNAVVHFGEVLERERNPEALAWLGYISFQVDELDTARNYLTEALELEPDYPQAEWWLANLLFYGYETPEQAVPHLEAVLAATDLPDDVRIEAQEMLDVAGGTG